jgi:hypothetical protein
MRYRVCFLLVTAFFITMNGLLWRSEFVGRSRPGTPVPAELVWEKVLTSPDPSRLEIHHHHAKIGSAHWTASIGEEPVPELAPDAPLPPEGMVKRPTSYALSFDGSVTLDDHTRLRFDFNLKLDTNQNWRELSLKFILKPFSWEILSSAETRTLRLLIEAEEKLDRTFTFDDLRSPDKIMRELGGPMLPGALAALGLQLPRDRAAAPAALPLQWDARNDRLRIGNNLVRVFRLEARLFDRWKATLFVSPVGEILRLELPDEIVMINDALINL